MAVEAEKVTVGTTATALNAVESHAFGGDRVSVLVKVPSGGSTIFVGGSDVDTTDGFPVAADESVSLDDLSLGEVAYGIIGTGTQDVNVLRHGVG